MSHVKQEITIESNQSIQSHDTNVVDLCSSSDDSDSSTESDVESSSYLLSSEDSSNNYSSDDDITSNTINTNNNKNTSTHSSSKSNISNSTRFAHWSSGDENELTKLTVPKPTKNNKLLSSNKNRTNSNRTSSKNKKLKKTSKISVIDNDEIRDKFSNKIYKSSLKTIKDLYGPKIKTLTSKHHHQIPPQQLTKMTNLMISPRYAKNAGWTEADGYREMIQNWFDACNQISRVRRGKTIIISIIHNQNMCYHYFLYKSEIFNIEDNINNEIIGSIIQKQERKQDVLKLCNYGIAMDANQIILGHTSKTNGESVGKFGEGLKMGACILLYYGHKLSILTNSKNWKFSFKLRKKYFQKKTLFVSPHQKDKSSPAQVIVTIKNIKKKSISLDNIINNIKTINICSDIERRYFFPLYHPKINEYININNYILNGNILFGNYYKNKIYHNGFYIGSHTGCYFGYNINGNILPLDRDRRLTSDALRTLQSQIPKYWKYAIEMDVNNANKYLKCVNKGKSNRECLELHPSSFRILLNERVGNALFDAFIKDLLNENNEEKQQEFKDVFIVCNDISHKEEEIVCKKLKKK
eukprot:422703_1